MDKVLSYVLCEEDLGATANGLVNLILKNRIGVTGHEISHAKFTENGITADGVRVSVKDRIRPGQRLTVVLADLPEEEEKVVPASCPFPLEILYEDEDLVAVNKPAGVPVHPNHGHYADTMANYLADYYEKQGLSIVIRIAGRLDKDTSGVLLFAKNRAAAGRLYRQRLDGTFRRRYEAVVHGVFPEDALSGTIDLPMEKDPDALMQQRISPEGKSAVTHYEVKQQTGTDALVSCTIDTGRTHQIRLHMSATGHPLRGDSLYGTPEAPGRSLLHAAELSLEQPFTREPLRIFAPHPEDFRDTCRELFLCNSHRV